MNTPTSHAPEFKPVLRAAMIGGGLNSAVGRVHEIALKMDNRFELVAGCFSRHPEVNAQSGQAYGVPEHAVFATPEALLQAMATQLDVVVIATPIQSHAEWIHRVLDHGLIPISDKPLVGTQAESKRLLERVDPEGTGLFVTYNYTGYPMVREMRRRIREGQIGRVFKIMAEMPQDSYMRLRNQNSLSAIQAWRLEDGEIPCLTLDLFVHLHSLVHLLTESKPQAVQAWSRSISQARAGLIDEVDAIVEYENDLILNAWYGKAALGQRNGLSIRVFGTEGSMEWIQEDPEHLHLANAQGDRFLIDRISSSSVITKQPRYTRFKAGHPAGFIEAFANYYVDVADAIGHGKLSEYTLSGQVTAEGLTLCHAIAQSSRLQRKVTLSEYSAQGEPAQVQTIRPKVLFEQVEATSPDANPSFQVNIPSSSLGGMTLLESSILVSLVRLLQPRALFEFGTFLGASTLLLAQNSAPDARIVTLDLPPDGASTRAPDVSAVLSNGDANDTFLKHVVAQQGAVCVERAEPSVQAKVQQVLINSLQLDVQASKWAHQFDFVLIDGGHDFDTIQSDTEKAYQLAAPDAVIVWHDYQSKIHRDVTTFLAGHSQGRRIYHVANTMIAFELLGKAQGLLAHV